MSKKITVSTCREGGTYTKRGINSLKVQSEFDISRGSDLNDLFELVQHRKHSFCEWKNGYRKRENFIRAHAVVLDFDSKSAKKQQSSIHQFVNTEFAQSHNWILYSSKSHARRGDSFHVVIPLSSPCESISLFEQLTREVKRELRSEGLRFDSVSPIQVFAPSVQDDHSEFAFHYEYELSQNYLSETIIESTVVPDNAAPIQEKSQWYQSTWESLTSKQKYKFLVEFAVHHRRVPMLFNEWAEIRNIFDTEMGPQKGYKLFKLLSLGYDHRTDTEEKVRYHWDRLRRSQRVQRRFHLLGWVVHSHKTRFHIKKRLTALIRSAPVPRLEMDQVVNILKRKAKRTGVLTPADIRAVREDIRSRLTVREFRGSFSVSRIITGLINHRVIVDSKTHVVRCGLSTVRRFSLQESDVTKQAHSEPIGIYASVYTVIPLFCSWWRFKQCSVKQFRFSCGFG